MEIEDCRLKEEKDEYECNQDTLKNSKQYLKEEENHKLKGLQLNKKDNLKDRPSKGKEELKDRLNQITSSLNRIPELLEKQEEELKLKGTQDLLKKQEQLLNEKVEVISRLHKEKEEMILRLNKEKEEIIFRLFKEKDELKDKHHQDEMGQQLQFSKDKQELTDRLAKAEMSHNLLKSKWENVIRTLNIRRVFEVFENDHIMVHTGSRLVKWRKFLNSKTPKARDVLASASKFELQKEDILQVVVGLYKRLSDDIHQSFERGEKVVIMSDYFDSEQTKLIKILSLSLPISEDDVTEIAGPIIPN